MPSEQTTVNCDVQAASRASKIFRLGRQPILGTSRELVGYELLYRDKPSDLVYAVEGDPTQAGDHFNALLEIGLDCVVGDALAFINVSKSFLDGTTEIPYDPQRVVVEILECVDLSKAVVDGARRLSDQGYRIALDNFVYSPQWDQLLQIADIVKLNITDMSEKMLTAHVSLMREVGIKVLAENVATHEQFAMCTQLGCDLFQGRFFARPNEASEKSTSASRMALLQTLAVVNQPDADPDEIDQAVKQDAVLAHKLLRLVNSSAFGLRSQVESIQQAVVYLGKETVRSMVNVLLMTAVDDKPTELMRTALVRALCCKNLAQVMGERKQDAFFAVGLLSTLDALLDRPLESIVNDLPIADTLREALLRHDGKLGACLDAALAFEQNAQLAADRLPLTISDQCQAYLDAIRAVEQQEGMASILPAEQSQLSPEEFRRKDHQLSA